MRFVRVAESAAEAQAEYDTMLAEAQAAQAQAAVAAAAPGDRAHLQRRRRRPGREPAAHAGSSVAVPPPVRFDLLATDGLGSPFLWRLLADYNDVTDPLRVAPGTVLAVPPGLAGATVPPPVTTAAAGGRVVKGVSGVPAVEVVVDGERARRRRPMPRSRRCRVARRLSLPAQCEVGFALRSGSSAALSGADVAVAVPIGAVLTVTVGGDQGRLFEGEVTAHEWVHAADGAAELRVRAYDGLHRLRKRQRVVARTAITVGELADELAGEAGLAAKADSDGPRWPVLVQHRQTDLELLQEVAEQAGLWFVGRRRRPAPVHPRRDRRRRRR